MDSELKDRLSRVIDLIDLNAPDKSATLLQVKQHVISTLEYAEAAEVAQLQVVESATELYHEHAALKKAHTEFKESAAHQIAELNKRHTEAMEQREASHAKSIAALKSAQAETIEQLNTANAQAVAELKSSHANEVAALQEALNQAGPKTAELSGMEKALLIFLFKIPGGFAGLRTFQKVLTIEEGKFRYYMKRFENWGLVAPELLIPAKREREFGLTHAGREFLMSSGLV